MLCGSRRGFRFMPPTPADPLHLEQPQLATAAELGELLEHVVAALRPGHKLVELWTWWQTTPEARRLTGRASIDSRMRRWVLPELGELRAGAVSAEDVDRALELAELAGKSAQTINHCITDLRRLVRAARGARRWPGPDPMEFVRRRTRLEVERPTLTLEEAAELLGDVEGKYQVIFALVLCLGLRKGEVLALELRDVDQVHQVLHVRRSHGRKATKNGRRRSLPILPELAAILFPWCELTAAAGGVILFPGRGAGGRMGRDAALSKRLRAALERIGLVELVFARRIRFHDLRHTFSTLAEEAGIPEEVRSAVLGHSPTITARYTHRRVERLRQAISPLQFTRRTGGTT